MEASDPRRIVADGYDRIAERRAAWALETRSEERARYVAGAGLRIEQAAVETAEEGGQPVSFLWIVGRKPGPGEVPGGTAKE
ncbi:MAG TPA: hypothetical protein VFS20_24245 [Longimicrobium sp.]|nr:hypothetical protein [Longimicrobium sp.]